MKTLINVLIIFLLYTSAYSQETEYLQYKNPINFYPKLELSDTLQVYEASLPKLEWNHQRTFGLIVLATSTALSYYFHKTADKYYSKYLRCGNIDKMKKLYAKAQKYDKFTGLSYACMETGFLIFVFSFDIN